MDLKHEGGHNLKIKYEWLQLQNEDFEMTEIDTGMLKEWTLLQIEGEEPVKEEVIDPRASPMKKVAPKTSVKNVVEEIIDNRPRTVQYKRDCAAENGDLGIRFTEQIATKFQTTVMKISVLENEKVVERIQLDLSGLLFIQTQVQVRKVGLLTLFLANLEIRSFENACHTVFRNKR